MHRQWPLLPLGSVLFVLLLIVGLCPAEDGGLPQVPPSAAGMDEARLATIVPRMQAYVAEGQAAGVVTLVARDGRIVLCNAVGLADIEAERAMQPDTIFAIASMTKPIAATALMILRDEGQIALDDPVAKYLPEFGQLQFQGHPPERPITLRDVMTHTAGLGGGQQNQGSLAETAAAIAQRPLLFQPGQKWGYSPGLTVCGRVVEVVAGQPFEQFLEQRIFGPLGMKDTTFFPDDARQQRLAQLYKPGAQPGSLEPTKHWISALGADRTANPSAGLFSTAGDMARFYQMILDGGQWGDKQIVSADSVRELTRVQTGDLTTGFTEGNGWGLGWCVVRQPQGATAMLSPGTYGHGGAFGTQGWVDPQRQMIFVLMVQRTGFGNSDAADLRRDFQQRAIDAIGFEVPAMTPQRTDVLPFEYVDEPEIPFYPPAAARKSSGSRVWPMQLPLTPEQSLKRIVTPVGFSAQLFAAEPDIVKPVCMAWDERGRLWIGETLDYPNRLQPKNRGNDTIKILEDTNGDGRADKFTVFADALSIPTSIAFYRGGVIVQNGTETLYLKDTTGDDRADVRQVLISGWNMGDTHGGVSNFQYGLDNWIWAMQGYNPSRPVVAGRPHPNTFRMGFFRFRPDGSELEFLRSTNNNTWGLGLSEDGLIFGSTANGNPSVYLPIPNRYYERVRGWSAEQLGGIADTYLFHPITDRIRQVDYHGGYTSAAGHALYTARHYPPPFWNRTAFVCGPTGKLVGTFVLKRDGADFHSTSPMNLMASDDEWTAPIMAEVGPDGNVWILDWYNYIVQHNPTPAGFQTGQGNAYETRLRDKRHGRIYRIVYRDANGSVFKPFSLADASPQELTAALKHPTMLWRKHAQRLLVERGQQDVVPELIDLVRDRSVDRVGLNVGAIHALWTLHGLGMLDGSPQHTAVYEAAAQALDHPSAGVRRNAIAVLPGNESTLTLLLDRALLADPDAQVRLAALLAMSEVRPSAAAGHAVAQFLNDPANQADRWLLDAAIAAGAAHDYHLLQSIAADRDNWPCQPRQTVLAVVSQHYARGAPADSVVSLVSALVDAHPTVAATVVDGLASGWPKDRPVDTRAIADQVWLAILEKLPDGSKGQWLRLAALWDSDSLKPYAAEIARSLLNAVADERTEDDARAAAARQVIEFLPDDADLVRRLVAQITPRSSPALASDIIGAIGSSRTPAAGPMLVEAFDGFTPAVKNTALGVLFSRVDWTQSLLDGIEQGAVPLSDLRLDQKQTLAAHPDSSIVQRFQPLLDRGGGLPSPDRQQVLDQLLPLTERIGDLAAGQLVYKEQCGKCHVFRGEGITIGPDLTGMSVHPKRDMLTYIIDPNRSVEGNYRVYTVVTVDGRIRSGLLASETSTSIEMFDAEGKRHVVLREDIDELVASTKSLMPEGFEKQVTERELVDLLEYLASRDRFTPLDLRKVATIVTTRGMFTDEASTTERLVFPDWSAKTFARVPFHLVDPQEDRIPNAVMLHSPNGKLPPHMPRQVELTVNQPAVAIHLLSGVGGWSAKQPREDGAVSMTVRLYYQDGQTEDHPLRDGYHFADYIGHFDVPGSQLAFRLRNQQIRYLAIHPHRPSPITHLQLIKGSDRTAPIVMAMTVEARE